MPDPDRTEMLTTQNRPVEPDVGEGSERGQSESHRQAIEAEALARAHYQVEPGLRAIYRLEGPDPNGFRIKLLEVNEQTVPTGIVPVGFAPHPASGVHYPSVVIEVTPQEYEAIQRRELNLPEGWEVRNSYERTSGSAS